LDLQAGDTLSSAAARDNSSNALTGAAPNVFCHEMEITRQQIEPGPEISANHMRAFPIEALPEPIQRISEEISKVARVPLVLPVMSVLSVLSLALGKNLRVLSGPSRTTAGNLYLIGFARTGAGKTEAFLPAFEPVRNLQDALTEKWTNEDKPIRQARL